MAAPGCGNEALEPEGNHERVPGDDAIEIESYLQYGLGMRQHSPALAPLGPRAINAIVRIWGPNASFDDLAAPGAYARLRSARGVGSQTVAEIELALEERGLAIGGRHDAGGQQRAITYRAQVARILKAEGVKAVVLMLVELCGERVAKAKQSLLQRSTRTRRAREQAAIAYYEPCQAILRESADRLPARVE